MHYRVKRTLSKQGVKTRRVETKKARNLARGCRASRLPGSARAGNQATPRTSTTNTETVEHHHTETRKSPQDQRPPHRHARESNTLHLHPLTLPVRYSADLNAFPALLLAFSPLARPPGSR